MADKRLSLSADKTVWEVTSSSDNHTLYTSGKYLDRDIVVKAIPRTSKDAISINGATLVNGTTGKDSYKVTITLPAGYYNAATLEKTFDDILPNVGEAARDENVLEGFSTYDQAGKLVVGSMTNNGNISGNLITMTAVSGAADATGTNITLTPSGTKPADTEGYITVHGSGTVSASYNIPNGFHLGGGVVTGSLNSKTVTGGEATVYYKMNNAVMSTSADSITLNILAPSNNKYTVMGDVEATTKVTTAGYAKLNQKSSTTVSASGTLNQSAISMLSAAGASATSITSQFAKISEGYYHEDRNITVRSASNLGLAITDKPTGGFTVSAKDANKYYTFTTSLEGKMTASTPGWFSSATKTDSSVKVGRLKEVEFARALAGAGAVTGVSAEFQVASTSAGYWPEGQIVAESVIAVYNGEYS